MAADDQQIGVVLLDCVAEDVPGLPFDHLYQSVHLQYCNDIIIKQNGLLLFFLSGAMQQLRLAAIGEVC